MNAERLGSVTRVLRVRARMTQAALGARAGVGRHAVSLLERGKARELRLGTVEAIAGTLGAYLDLRVLWNGPELDRLLDAGHAALAASEKRRLERWGWVVRVEVSYSRYGERGRVDILAWHPERRSLLVTELKTELVDVQALLGSIDIKARLGTHIARGFGWEISDVIPAIVFAENRTTRRRVAALDVLFDRFPVRGRDATSWLRRPDRSIAGALWYARAGRTPRQPTLRVRRRRPSS